MAMMLGMIGFMVYNAQKYRWGRHCNKYGPAWLATCAALLIMADLTRHVLQDLEWWKGGDWPGSSEYRSDCHEENFSCLSVLGWVFTVVMTYLGFTLLFIATMWNAKICDKIKDFRRKWAELRAESAAQDN